MQPQHVAVALLLQPNKIIIKPIFNIPMLIHGNAISLLFFPLFYSAVVSIVSGIGVDNTVL